MSAIDTYTAVLPVDRACAQWLSRKLTAHRRAIGTRRLTPWVQAVYVLRFLIDDTRIKQLAADNALPKTTTYEYLWEGLEVPARCAPTLAEAIDTARRAGDAHIGLDGTLIPTNRSRIEGPTQGCDLFYSGKHHRHGANLHIISAPDGFPL